MATYTPPKLEPRLRAPQATGRPGVSSAGTGRPHQIWSFSYGPGGWACCVGTRPMGGWASISFFCSGRAGGRRDFVVENRVGVSGRPGTPGPVGGPACRLVHVHPPSARAPPHCGTPGCCALRQLHRRSPRSKAFQSNSILQA